MMLETARELSRLSLHSIKIHLLHVLKGTVMAEQLQRGEFRLLEREEYVNIVCDQLELLPPELIVQRVTGDGEKEALIGPQWSLKKLCVLNEIDKELVPTGQLAGKILSKISKKTGEGENLSPAFFVEENKTGNLRKKLPDKAKSFLHFLRFVL